MGLVNCSKCGKIYEYDKYNGICPKCARYNKETSSAEEHQEFHNKYDGGYSHTAQDDHHSFHQRYDDNKNPHGSQLDGVQQTLREVMGAEHKVTLEVENTKKAKPNKKVKIIVAIIGLFVFINLIPFLSFLIFPIVIGVMAYLVNRKK